jgi:nucleotide-binding universal stress UspA family protein
MEKLLNTILCPVDYSVSSTLALQHAEAFADQYDARLVVYHSLPIGKLTDDSTSILEKFVESSLFLDTKIEYRIESDVPAAAGILAAAKKEKADLIVMGTRGLSGYQQILIGSVTNEVLHKSQVPVLTICKPVRSFLPENPQAPMQIKNIVCAVDPINANLRMKNLALSLARSFQSHLLFVEVQESPGQQSSLKNLEGLIQPEKEDWSTIDFLSETGDPVEKLLLAANNNQADLMIIGHHTRKPIEWEILGSVAYNLVPLAPCPVLVVRNP